MNSLSHPALRKFLRINVLLALIASIASFFIVDCNFALAVFSASIIGTLNTWAMSYLVNRLLEQKRVAAAGVLLGLKFIVLGGLFALLALVFHLSALGLGVGFSTTVLSLLWTGLMNAEN